MRFYVRTWTGPTLVERMAVLTGLQAGTERIYGFIEADSEDDAVEILLNRLNAAGVSGFSIRDIYIEERSGE